MQQQGGRSQYGASPFSAAVTSTDPITQQQQQQQQHQLQQQRLGDPGLGAAEEASPISSRPPAGAHLSSVGNFDEHLLVATGSGGLPDDDALGGDEADRGGGSGGNRWPRQETLALLKIRSDMDATFRDATLKGPLWEDVSRKLAELGYKRSAKKCKEKFENVHKYYKRTKEGRAGRQDGKSYRFFTQLEALHTTVGSSSVPPPLSIATTPTTAAATTIQLTAPVPVSMTTMPISSVRVPTPLLVTPSQTQAQVSHNLGLFPPDFSAAAVLPGTAAAPTTAVGVSFSSDSSSSSSGSDEMDDEDDDMDLEPELMEAEPSNRLDRKRKRASSRHNSSSSQKMMEFFEGLMKQVMQKQEALQQRFLEAIEKREQDRMIREEAWKRQEMARLAREHDLMAQERAISASRDAAIIAFLQKITGQTIQLPPAVNVPAGPQPQPPTPQVSVPQPPSQPLPPPPPPPTTTDLYQKTPQHYQQQQQQQQQQLHQHQNPQTSVEVGRKHQPPTSTEIVVAVPEQQVAPQEMGGGGSFEAASSRWPKAEVLALIKLRSGLEPRYQEAGPKGPLWEEISAGMHRMGYKRNPKRCKEKWENINKYFKKVKESNKKRPEDAKTCPYFHELDALYRKKILGTPSSGGVGSSSSHRPEDQSQLQQQQQSVMMDPKFQERSDIPAIVPSAQATETENKDSGGSTTIQLQTSNGDLTATLFGEGSDGGAAGGAKKPEDILKEQQHQNRQHLSMNDFGKMEEPDSDMNLDQDQEDDYNDDDDDDDDDDDGDEEAQEEMKMAYKIQFQRPNAGSSNGGGNGTASFLAMVQ